MDDETHKKWTGGSNKQILDNLRKLSKIHKGIHVRMPIIVGVNDNEGHINGALELIKELGIKRVSLLPYHDIAKHKYTKLGLPYKTDSMGVPTKEYMEECRKLYSDSGLEVTIGG